MLGAVPLIGTGTGSEFRQPPLGYAIVGGLALSQLLTRWRRGCAESPF